jgi:hypothetical protein
LGIRRTLILLYSLLILLCSLLILLCSLLIRIETVNDRLVSEANGIANNVRERIRASTEKGRLAESAVAVVIPMAAFVLAV